MLLKDNEDRHLKANLAYLETFKERFADVISKRGQLEGDFSQAIAYHKTLTNVGENLPIKSSVFSVEKEYSPEVRQEVQ